jgi:5-methylcytosine-specific restriction endonuclease McrA
MSGNYKDITGHFEPQSLLDLLNRRRQNQVIHFNGYKVKIGGLRYKTFSRQRQCCVCKREIAYGVLQQPKILGTCNPKAAHFNFYSEDGVLFTKDHIIPKSLGGSDSMCNFQTMCSKCNSKKGNSYEAKQD